MMYLYGIMRFHLFLVILASLAPTLVSAQITVTNTTTPAVLVMDTLIGDGVSVSNIEFNQSISAAESITNRIGYFDASGTSFPMERGIIISTGHVDGAVGPNSASNGTTTSTTSDPVISDLDLEFIATSVAYDQTVLEFDLIPLGDSVYINYVFASEEYPEFVGASFNDVFGFFVSGPGFSGPYEDGGINVALVPGTPIPIAINNVNNGTSESGPCTNCAYYISNAGGSDVEYDAYTTSLFAEFPVDSGSTYHIKFAIADVGDAFYDSGIFLGEKLITSNYNPPDTTIDDTGLNEGNFDFKLYPVPVQNELTLEFSQNKNTSNLVIEIYSLDGQFLSSHYSDGSSIQKIDFPFESGHYLIKVTSESGFSSRLIQKF